MKKNVVIVGVGSYVPEVVLTNEDIERMRPADIPKEEWTNDEWIFPRTGIRERRIAPDGWGSSDLMLPAARAALKDAGREIGQIDLLVTSSSFHDRGFNVPRIAELLKSRLNVHHNLLSVEENAACTGFCWALARTEMELLNPKNGFKTALVVSGDKTTSAVNYTDRRTCILFGDAAGAMVLERCRRPGYGILDSIRETDTAYIDCMDVAAGGSVLPFHKNTDPTLCFMRIPGSNQMLKIIGGKVIPDLCRRIAKKAGIALLDVEHILFHQANDRITDVAEERLVNEIRPGAIFRNIEFFGNTSGSSIPLAIDVLYRSGGLEPGDYIITLGFGAGFTYGANLIRWSKPKFGKGE